MASSTELPRGTNTTVQTSAGTAAGFTIPAAPGIIHVLDSFSASLVALSAAAAGTSVNVNVNGVIVLSALALNGGAAGADRDGAQGIGIQSLVGGALTVAFNAVAPANYVQLLIIEWHDI